MLESAIMGGLRGVEAHLVANQRAARMRLFAPGGHLAKVRFILIICSNFAAATLLQAIERAKTNSVCFRVNSQLSSAIRHSLSGRVSGLASA